MWISLSEKTDVFGRLRSLESNVQRSLDLIESHIRGCNEGTALTRVAEARAADDRRTFRREMRSYAVAIIVALAGIAAAGHWNLL